jgi:SAM-dependent methyltransferase
VSTSPKRYDRDYYRRFYLDPATRVLGAAERRRRVALVVALAERWLDRPLRSVLDFGCGLGLWGREIARLRPSAGYLGIEPSEAVPAMRRERFRIVRGSVGAVLALPSSRRFDLVLCLDVLHYLTTREVDSVLDALVPRARGPLVLEMLTSAEPIEGDLEGLVPRSPRWWRSRIEARGLVPVGCNAWLPAWMDDRVSELETLRHG